MRIKSNFSKILLIYLAIVSIFTFSVKAHEFQPKRYWNDIYFHSSMNKHVVRLRVNITNVTNSVYNRKLRDAINDWEYLDDGYCDIQVTTSSSKIMVYDTFPSTYNQNAYATTTSTFNSANILYYPNGITGSVITQACNKITKASIYANISRQRQDNFNEGDIAKTWVHELGHVMGLNETNDNTRSVMKQGQGSTLGWSNYWQPQTHDITDLARYHRVSWGGSAYE